ncbi:Serine/threonine-protein phosphatase 2A activator [Orchesella cincta]|uniref:Serine/threonine-protein phosphatase 2A activator n=1 Tax=Orchesella cincta TaxID=48709 RepID=A0A1D2N3F1_ORCCI|nr:Serine/threonine-protein phosphatase 2A activator [Orchesella cincta]
MAALGDGHIFAQPKREIISPMDLDKWLKSEAYQELIGFLESLNEAVKGKPLSVSVTPSPVVAAIVEVLNRIDEIIDQTPAIDQPQRFGNKAFATFYSQLQNSISSLLKSALPDNFHGSVDEISVYLTESVGNSTRIDYGTGHEFSFVMFLYCLFRIGALDTQKADDRIAAVTCIFSKYMVLVRKLQITYRMEPAGSHGVWSLDDFQFIPFIWGSSQFVGNPIIDPSSFTDSETVHKLASEYLFMGCIEYILKVKSGPFHEHSNQLWNISGTQSWSKINQGLIKMYKAEVLAKFPVVQHVLFGSLLSIKPMDPTKMGKAGRPGTGIGILTSGLKGISLPPQLNPADEPNLN